MELSTIQANLISLVGTVASLAFGLGAFSSTTEQIVVSAAGTLISLGFSLFVELRANTTTKAAIASAGEGNPVAKRTLGRRAE